MGQPRMSGHRGPMVIIVAILLMAVIVSIALLGPVTTLVIVAIMTVVAVVCAGRAQPPGSGPAGDREAPWAVQIRRVDEAVAQRNAIAADLAWHDAYAAALGSRRWEGMLEFGDAALRLGEAGGDRSGVAREARRAYLIALNRARAQGSLDGVLRVAEAFAALGDWEIVGRCVRIAESLAAQAREAQASAVASGGPASMPGEVFEKIHS